MHHRIVVLPQKQNIDVAAGAQLLQVLREAGLAPEAPCGGNGRCGKCKVLLEGREVLACQTVVDRDMIITNAYNEARHILTDGIAFHTDGFETREGFVLAFDIGTTTVAGFLLDGKTGRELACESTQNPQAAYGADVISRIQHALNGHMEALSDAIGSCVEELANALCENAGVQPEQITHVSIVGNPAMQQLYFGISPDNLVRIPFSPVLTQAKTVKAATHLPACRNAELLVVPDISGYVGADTVACLLATEIVEEEAMTLLVDIGTNGEMVLGNRQRMVACSTAAGPALEGANICCGMGGRPGAIDHVWLEKGDICCSVIGGGEAVGICGSGLVDAVAVVLELGLINGRGKILGPEPFIRLTDRVMLTQEDIRQVQMAKGAIAAGIALMAAHLNISMEEIDRVYLAGAFGTFMNPKSACRIGLLPPELEKKITAVGNAAGSGAKILAVSDRALRETEDLVSRTEYIELASLPQFAKTFSKEMRFAIT